MNSKELKELASEYLQVAYKQKGDSTFEQISTLTERDLFTLKGLIRDTIEKKDIDVRVNIWLKHSQWLWEQLKENKPYNISKLWDKHKHFIGIYVGVTNALGLSYEHLQNISTKDKIEHWLKEMAVESLSLYINRSTFSITWDRNTVQMLHDLMEDKNLSVAERRNFWARISDYLGQLLTNYVRPDIPPEALSINTILWISEHLKAHQTRSIRENIVTTSFDFIKHLQSIGRIEDTDAVMLLSALASSKYVLSEAPAALRSIGINPVYEIVDTIISYEEQTGLISTPSKDEGNIYEELFEKDFTNANIRKTTVYAKLKEIFSKMPYIGALSKHNPRYGSTLENRIEYTYPKWTAAIIYQAIHLSQLHAPSKDELYQVLKNSLKSLVIAYVDSMGKSLHEFNEADLSFLRADIDYKLATIQVGIQRINPTMFSGASANTRDMIYTQIGQLITNYKDMLKEVMTELLDKNNKDIEMQKEKGNDFQGKQETITITPVRKPQQHKKHIM